MLDIKIKNTTTEDTLQSEEEFMKDIYNTPLVTSTKHITYSVNSVDVKTHTLIGTGRLPIYGQTVKSWMIENKRKKLSLKVVEDALNATACKVIGKSRTELVCGCKETDTLAYQSFEMAKRRFDNSHSKGFVKSLKNQRGVDIEKYRFAYLYRHTGCSIHWKMLDNEDDLQDVKMNISWRLIKTYSDYMSERKVDTIEDILDYIEYLCDEFQYCTKEARKILDEVIVSHKIWDILSTDDIIEAISWTGEEDREWIELDDIINMKEK